MSHVKKHVLLLSFPSYGHMIPLLELGKKIGKHHHVTFAVSTLMVKELQKRELLAELSQYNIEVVGIEDGYSEDCDKAGDPTGMIEAMFKYTVPAAQKYIESLFDAKSTSRPVDVGIADSFLGGPISVCHQHGVPLYLFNTANSGITMAFLMTNEDDPVVERPEDADPFLRPSKPGSPPQPQPLVLKKLMLESKKVLPLTTGIIVNSFYEIEKDILNVLNKIPVMKYITVSCVGPLIPEEKEGQNKNQAAEQQVNNWLSAKEKGSVVYVSFGSVAVPSPEQVHEIGQSLLLLNKPFIFSLRAGFIKYLPKEIQDGITKDLDPQSNFLVTPWSPQKLILMHPATGVFVTHCGWNSTLEALFGGVPMIGWPMFADQLLNAMWLVDHGIGRMVEGTGMKPERVVPAQEISEIIADVAGWSKGHEGVSSYTAAARSWEQKIKAAVGPNGSSQKEFDELVMFERHVK